MQDRRFSGRVRPAERADVPAIVRLRRKSFRNVSNLPTDERQRAILEVLFEAPWQREPNSSVVCEADDGRLVGFLGIFDRKMKLNGEPVRAGITAGLATDPDERAPQVPFLLLNSVFADEHDLIVTDGANGDARKIWLACGGQEIVSSGIHWVRPLRPAAYASDYLQDRLNVPEVVGSLIRPFCSLIDQLSARLGPNRFKDRLDGLERSFLESEELIDRMPEFLAERKLVPSYSQPSLEWTLRQASLKSSQGQLRRIAVRDPDAGLIGWYLYYHSPHRVGEVLQVAAQKSRQTDVLHSLYADAWERGVIALRGRVDPPMAHSLSRTHCLFFYEGPWTLAYSTDDRIRAAVHAGDAWLSGLEGERWMR